MSAGTAAARATPSASRGSWPAASFAAFTELVDPAEQRSRFEAQAALRAAGDDEAMAVDEDYLPGPRLRASPQRRPRDRRGPPGDAPHRHPSHPRRGVVPHPAPRPRRLTPADGACLRAVWAVFTQGLRAYIGRSLDPPRLHVVEMASR